MQHPKRLGKYDIIGMLGEGAMGVVYKAFDPGIGRPVAIKTIRTSLSKDSNVDASISERFLNEARAVGRLNHPGIVAIYELGEDRDITFIAMEYVEGRDLSQILTNSPTFTEPMVLRVMHQLLDALEYAHQHGVWHRDIKPANLIITAAGQLKITDFGIAKIESAAITQVVSTIGTPGYMAPEQYIGETFDHRVDIFAAGVLLYRMLTGEAPFTGSAQTVMYNIMNSDPSPLNKYIPNDVAAFYEPVVSGALVKDPAKRFANAMAFRSALLKRTSVEQATATEATIIVQSERGREARPPVNQSINGYTGNWHTNATALTGWDDDVLAPIQNALARTMGPMAKVLVRQAVKKCNDLQSLVALLSNEIPNADDKAKFLSLLQKNPNATVTNSMAIATTATRHVSNAMGHLPVAGELIEFANLALAKHLGPIAKIFVKRAVAKATSPEHFVALLAQEVTEGPMRSQLLGELQSKL